MNFDTNSLLLSLVIGSIGFVLFVYGKRQSRFPHLIVGIILSVYPYFVENLILQGAIAVVLCVGLWFAVRLGW